VWKVDDLTLAPAHPFPTPLIRPVQPACARRCPAMITSTTKTAKAARTTLTIPVALFIILDFSLPRLGQQLSFKLPACLFDNSNRQKSSKVDKVTRARQLNTSISYKHCARSKANLALGGPFRARSSTRGYPECSVRAGLRPDNAACP